MYEIIYTKKAAADIPKLKAAKLDGKAKALIELIKQNPYQTPPRYERLKGDLEALFRAATTYSTGSSIKFWKR